MKIKSLFLTAKYFGNQNEIECSKLCFFITNIYTKNK